MFVICINKLALKIMKQNEMTLLPNQYIRFIQNFLKMYVQTAYNMLVQNLDILDSYSTALWDSPRRVFML